MIPWLIVDPETNTRRQVAIVEVVQACRGGAMALKTAMGNPMMGLGARIAMERDVRILKLLEQRFLDGFSDAQKEAKDAVGDEGKLRVQEEPGRVPEEEGLLGIAGGGEGVSEGAVRPLPGEEDPEKKGGLVN